MITIIPAFLTHTEEEFAVRLGQLPNDVSLIHVDVMDGEFVQNETWADPARLEELLPETMRYEAHFMVADPLAYCHEWGNGHRYDKLSRMIFHSEAIEDIDVLSTCVRAAQKEFWLAWNPETRFTHIESSLDAVDGILVMGVTPGFSGQAFQDVATTHVRMLKERVPKLMVHVDGGVADKTATALRNAGVDGLVSASYLFEGDAISARISTLQGA
jgi:ribulose-phosphate 3-epimerase